MIKKVIWCYNGMVVVFDEKGEQMPEYQGHYDKVWSMIMRDKTTDTVFDLPLLRIQQLAGVEQEYPDCKCGVVMRIWNLDPERYEFRQNWLAQNVPSVFKEIGKEENEEGVPVHILRCRDCGNEIKVPLV